jgi:PAS domain S-box-containing protein
MTSMSMLGGRQRYQRLLEADPEAMYRMLVDSIPSSVLLIDEHLQVVLANRNFLAKARRSEAETLGRPLIEAFPRVIVEELQLEKQIHEVFASRNAFDGQRLTYRAPGVPLRTYYYSIIPMIWRARVELAMLLMDDVTEQLHLAEEIRRVERHLASVVESANELVLSTDTNGRILTWNRAAERLSGLRLAEVEGRPLWACCAADCQPELEAFFAIEAPQSGSGAAEYDLVRRDGTRIPVAWVFSPMKDDSGRISGIVAVGRDLTERRKLEAQLLQSQKLAALGVMAGGIAHEVRTPLAISSSAAQFLMEDDITPEFRKECAGKVHIGIHRASGIIENLLRFANPSARVDASAIDLPPVLRDAITLVVNQAHIQKVDIVRQFEEGVRVKGVASLLEHTFLNLFLNALNAMPDGGTLTVSAERSAATVRARVRDTGCGIARCDIDHIFDPFYTRAKVGKGTGLGLSICYSVVQQHGGSIEVESEPGKGSTFTVNFPALGEPGADAAIHLPDRR